MKFFLSEFLWLLSWMISKVFRGSFHDTAYLESTHKVTTLIE
jgi:hypothetical protein